MSRASVQSISLLATVAGSMDVAMSLKTEDTILHHRFMDSYLQKTQKLARHAVCEWSCSGNGRKNEELILHCVSLWGTYLNKIDVQLTVSSLVSLSLQCVTDLHTKIKDPYKLNLLNPIFKPLHKVSDYLDQDGDKFEEYEYVASLMNKLYQIIGFQL